MAGLLVQIPQLPSATTIQATDFIHIRDATRDRKITYADFIGPHIAANNPHNITKATIGLDDVDNVPVFDRRRLFDEVTADADKATARSNLDIPSFSDLQAAVPTGVIMMWSGAVVDIPAGYGLCDGTNGTPNLVGRFIVGVNASETNYKIGEVGGVADNNHEHTVTVNGHTLKWDEIPPHKHSGAGEGNGGRNRFGIDPRYPRGQWGWEYGDNDSYYWLTSDAIFHPSNSGTYISGEGNNKAHSHSTTVGTTQLDNRPPYYALAYIMKL